MKTKSTVYFLAITNIFTLIALLIVSFHYDVPQKVLHQLGISLPRITDSNYRYTDNHQYEVRRSLFKVYRPKNIKIVMLGNSITYGADWHELLSRNDIANRGIGSDITEGFLNRLTDIYELNPDICFIMGGINDVGKGIQVETIFSNYTEIIGNLKSHNIKPIIQSTLYVSSKRHNWKQINREVDKLNTLLKEYANSNSVPFLDINKELSVNGALKLTHTYDGVHLLGSGYDKWRELILKELENH